MYSYKILNKKVILKIRNRVCETPEELIASEPFKMVLDAFVRELTERQSKLCSVFGHDDVSQADQDRLIEVLKFLTKMPANLVPNVVPQSETFFADKDLLSEFVEQLYNYWRSFDRFVVCDSKGDGLDQRPYRTFNETIEKLMHLVRFVYRNVEENITGDHPRIYRQVRAGAEIAAIAEQKTMALPEEYQLFNDIGMIRQILLYPPLVINPPMNKRTGKFERVDFNPVAKLNSRPGEWLCYPAKVGHLLVLIYFHEQFYDLGFSLSNLFELANDNDLERKPDAIYFFGVDAELLAGKSSFPTVFYDDQKNDLLVAAVPRSDEFGYFGYLKKMVLTLHNIKMMKRGDMPFHGALLKITLRGKKEKTVLIIGDTGAGKSETLEAFRQIGKKDIQDLSIIADDMGSLKINSEGQVIGYGTEIGAFLRLDDLQPGYAFGQMDRSIIMNPHKVNARIVIPVSSFPNVIKGHRVDMVLYANNYESIDEDHPIIEKFNSVETAFNVFKEGTVMSKGTTTSTGLVHSYFANIFGPPQYKNLHEEIARKYFAAFFKAGIFVGQLRTRLGIQGFENDGPQAAAKELLDFIK